MDEQQRITIRNNYEKAKQRLDETRKKQIELLKTNKEEAISRLQTHKAIIEDAETSKADSNQSFSTAMSNVECHFRKTYTHRQHFTINQIKLIAQALGFSRHFPHILTQLNECGFLLKVSAEIYELRL